jgi:mannose-6-phosphate isomerase-like protein (cupin superfamily)
MSFYPLDEKKEYFIEEGCFITEILNTHLEPNISIAKARLEAGKRTKSHKLIGTKEYYQIIKGRGKACIGDNEIFVEKGDVVSIDIEEPQYIVNLGDEDLIFTCICHPRFLQKNYLQLE